MEIPLSNVLEFTFLLNFDFGALLIEFMRHIEDQRGNLYARLITLVIHESTKTMKSMLGMPFQDALVAALGRDSALADARSIHQRATVMYKHSKSLFGDVRNGIIAHRHSDADTRLRLLATMDDNLPVLNLALDMANLIAELLTLSQGYLDALKARSY
jgi:hypothetical protein